MAANDHTVAENTHAGEVRVQPEGIFCRHPDTGKPNLLMAGMILDRIDFEKKRINGILAAILELLPKSRDETLESLVWAAYRLNEDKTPLRNLRKALCLPDEN